MKFVRVDPEEVMQFEAFGCAPGGGRSERVSIPVQRVICDGLPDELDGILVTSDLQYYHSREVNEEERVLMGNIVAQEMAGLGEAGMFPPPERTGVILAGDFYAEPGLNKRGGLGDVEEIWKLFAERFRWVVGVAGNHDLFAGKGDSFGNVFRNHSNAFPLHGDNVVVDGMTIAGVSGILGGPGKAWRSPMQEFSELMALALVGPADILVMHLPPKVPEQGLRGDSFVNQLLHETDPDLRPKNLVVGHCHWEVPLAELDSGVQALNVDSRVVLLVRE